MNKISFPIPNRAENINKIEINEDVSLSKQEKYIHHVNNIKVLNDKNRYDYNNYNNYKQICPNVYKFYSNDDIEINNINILYSNACIIKHENKSEALNMFKKCKELIDNNTINDIKYEIFINLALLTSELPDSNNDIIYYYEEAIKIYPDRSEPYYYWSIYCNNIGNFSKAYELLKKSLSLCYDDVKIKYPNTQRTAYDKYLYEQLLTTCYKLEKYDEAIELIVNIIKDPEFFQYKENLENTLKLIKLKSMEIDSIK